MADNINMTVITQPDVSVTVTGFGVKGDKGDAGDPATNLVTSVAGKTGAVTLDKTDVGLSNVDNLAPADMPVSTATQTALNAKANASDTVNLTGNQTVAGVKTFSSSPIAPSGTSIGGALHLTGTGFPEGIVTAPVGSVYIDTAVTNGASSWTKKSGTGNTGWVVSVGDTGWRRITSFLNGWTGVLDVRRVNDVLHYRTAYSGATALVGTAATSKVFLAPNTLGSGMFFVGEHRTHNYRPTGAVMGNSYYYHTGWELPAFGTAADVYTFPAGSFFFLDSAWPTTLPGVSA